MSKVLHIAERGSCTDEIPALLTVGEVAAALRVSGETVRRRISDGSLEAVRFGTVIRVPAVELERVLRPGVEQ